MAASSAPRPARRRSPRCAESRRRTPPSTPARVRRSSQLRRSRQLLLNGCNLESLLCKNGLLAWRRTCTLWMSLCEAHSKRVHALQRLRSLSRHCRESSSCPAAEWPVRTWYSGIATTSAGDRCTTTVAGCSGWPSPGNNAQIRHQFESSGGVRGIDNTLLAPAQVAASDALLATMCKCQLFRRLCCLALAAR